MKNRACLLVSAVLLVGLPVLVPPPALAEPPQPAPVNAAKLREAQSLLDEAKYKEAVKAFKALDKTAGGSCVECQIGLARAYNKLGAFKEALKYADAVLAAVGEKGEKVPLIEAYNVRGLALVEMAREDPKQLEPAAEAFRRAYQLSEGKLNTLRFSLAVTLLRLSRDAEGVALLKEYLEHDPKAPSADVAKDLIANPLRARKRLIPELRLVTLKGDSLTSSNVEGKVLLLDFWGTWCGPCREAVPGLRRLSEHLKDDPFMLVSISTDADETALRKFIEKNQMTWPQVWDKQSELTHKWGIHTFPTYLLVSPEGEIVHVVNGWSPAIERALAAKVQSALDAARKSTKEAG